MWQRKVISPEGRRDGAQPWAQGTWPPTLSNIAPCSTSCKNTQWTNPFVLFPKVFQLTALLQACICYFTHSEVCFLFHEPFCAPRVLSWHDLVLPHQPSKGEILLPFTIWARVQRIKPFPTQTCHRIVLKKNTGNFLSCKHHTPLRA